MPKTTNIGFFGPKSYLKMPKAQLFFNQNDCWVEIIEWEKWVENLSCRAAMVTKIVKKTQKIYKGLKQKKYLSKTWKYKNFEWFWPKKKSNIILKISSLKTSKTKKNLKKIKMVVTKTKTLLSKRFYYYNIKNCWLFLSKIKNKIIVFIGAFTWNHS